ncbi:MAG: hypothetical protein KKF46_07740 [Nanoarchaeota archaeon]|nr:hypothetical protein [Nanoarchaeota archaeon]MBU1322220.1 hypothetical protein [Nanoarchaeota archaeon]MBU1597761.1 hypothetical protein [Nanoarchaeota archaeon]MBU2442025.1 hypothetical protein [Nanoarchaeota archaeon]
MIDSANAYIVDEPKLFRVSEPYSELRSFMEALEEAKKLDEESIKSALNTTKTCFSQLHCIYFPERGKNFQEYLMFPKLDMYESGNDARDYLEDLLRIEIERKFGKQAADDYSGTYMGWTPLINNVREKNGIIGVYLSHATDDLVARYIAFIEPTDEERKFEHKEIKVTFSKDITKRLKFP